MSSRRTEARVCDPDASASFYAYRRATGGVRPEIVTSASMNSACVSYFCLNSSRAKTAAMGCYNTGGAEGVRVRSAERKVSGGARI